MTAKRFYVEKSENQDTIFDNKGIDDYYHLGNDTRDVNALCRLLNELHETNEQLQHDATILIQSNQDYRKENEELKHSIKCLEADKMELQQYIKRMQGDDGND